MKRMHSCLLLLGLAAVGCNSTGVGNPPGVDTVSLPLIIASDPEVEPEPTDTGEQLDASSLRHAVLVFGELRFIACDTPDNDAVIDGEYAVDLAQNTVEPPLPRVALPAAGFCGIDATLAPATTPPSLAGRSMFFSGLRTDGALFLMFADMPGTLRMRPRLDRVWPTDGKHGWLWALRPRRWLLPSELDTADSTPLDGIGNVIAIDVNRHPILYQAIRARVARRSTLHIDLNDNEQLDPNERTGSAYIGQGLDTID